MKTKTNLYLLGLSIGLLSLTSCEKNCHECHYDLNNAEVDLGEKCDEELEKLEKDGYTVDGVTYEVHCHEH